MAQRFHHHGKPADVTVGDFFVWAYSDLLSNALRGVLAEFIVGSALGACTGRRTEWEPYDLVTPSGVTVEVKSAAYIQSWAQRAPSRITFGIAPARAWDAVTATFGDDRRRQSDVYVFALLAEQDTARIDPLDLDQWLFFVLPTRMLDERVPGQQTLALTRLRSFDPIETDYNGLAGAVAVVSSLPEE